MAHVTVVGSFVVDYVATMERFPQAGETIIGKQMQLFLGGKGANQCVSIARLGENVSMVGMVGNDANGEDFKRLFVDEGINVDYVFTTDKQLTGCAQVQINGQSQNRICVIPGANYQITMADIAKAQDVIAKSKYVLTQLELPIDVELELVGFCHKLGVPVVLNPAPAVPIPTEVLSKLYCITPNETELALLSGLPADTDEEIVLACKKLCDLGVTSLVVTLGSRGCFVCEKGEGHFVDSYKVTSVDTVAAGDSFSGALIVALAEGKSLLQSSQFATAMGALTVQTKGAIPSLSKRSVVEEFIRQNGVAPVRKSITL